MNQTDYGKALAKHVNETIFDSHRGAFIRRDELVVYGNDGYEADELGRAKREVETILAWAKEVGLNVTDFGTDEDGYSWAIVFRGAQPDELAGLAVTAEDVLWDGWGGGKATPIDEAFKSIQMQQSMKAGEWPSEGEE